MRLGKAGDRIDQQQHMPTLVAEMLGHRHRRQRAARRTSGDWSEVAATTTPRAMPCRPEHPLGKLAQLAPAFADQRDHDDIRLDPARELRQQRGFADARSGEKTDPLAADQRQQRVEDRDTRCPAARPDAGAGAAGGAAARRARGCSAAQQRATVQRLAEGIDDPADPAVVGRNLGPAEQFDPVADRHAVGRRRRAGPYSPPRRQAQHLAPDRPVAAADQDPVAEAACP